MRRVLLATLLSSLTLTAAAATGKPANDASAPTSRMIATGVTSPRLVYAPHISIPADELPLAMVNPTTVVLQVKLDETGSPTQIQLLRAINQAVDARVIQGVRQFRWAPAVLNNQAVPSVLTLNVEVQR
ncbi:MAG TPA: energy transducer TonB [Terracidiphilus sp.]|nr:energy transducer TonB [Terracidiphilus sp.]